MLAKPAENSVFNGLRIAELSVAELLAAVFDGVAPECGQSRLLLPLAKQLGLALIEGATELIGPGDQRAWRDAKQISAPEAKVVR